MLNRTTSTSLLLHYDGANCRIMVKFWATYSAENACAKRKHVADQRSKKALNCTMATRSFYGSARRPLGLSNHRGSGSEYTEDDPLNLSDVIRMASAATDNTQSNADDSDLSGLSDEEDSRRGPSQECLDVSNEAVSRELCPGQGFGGNEMYNFHSTPQSSPASVSSYHGMTSSSFQTSVFNMLQKQSELIA